MTGNLPYPLPGTVRIRATATLPGSPTWWTSDWIPCRGFLWATFYFEYDRGAADGAVQFYLEFRPNLPPGAAALGAYQMSAYYVGALVAGADTASNIQRELVTYTSVDANSAGFIFGPIALRATAEAFRLVCTETGDAQSPGDFGADVQITVEK